MFDRQERALWWLRRGFWLLPCQPGTKRLCKGYGENLAKLKTSNQVKNYFGESNSYNLAVTPIATDQTILLDFDDAQVYQEWAQALPDLAQTYTERTPRGGYHVALFAINHPIPAGLVLKPGAELKRVFLVAPSVVDGKPYQAGAGEILEAEPEKVFSPLSIPGHPTAHLATTRHLANQSTTRGIISQIKNALPLLDLIAQEVPTLQTFGNPGARWITARCPFHKAGQEKEPSFWIDTRRNLWGCHACGKHGDAVNLYAALHGLTVNQAIDDLRDRVGAL